jgi:CubicO group peptidase (beta-lactamase class C family)
MSVTLNSSLDELLASCLTQFEVPGLAIAEFDLADVRTSAGGVSSLEIEIPVTPETRFQIGSVSKLVTAILVMQLVEAGKINIDDPMSRLLPELASSPGGVKDLITVRDLLRHTSGLAGDFEPMDNAGIASYVSRCSGLPQHFPPGEVWSYNNAAYVILGRIIETLTGVDYADAVDRYVFQRLGLEQSDATVEDASGVDYASGHVPGSDGRLAVSPAQRIGLSLAPAGAVIRQSVLDLARFGQSLLRVSLEREGPVILRSESLRRMVSLEHPLSPNPLGVVGWGLGFSLYPSQIFGHDGATIGQRATLRIAPEQGRGIVILSNGSSPDKPGLHDAILTERLPECVSSPREPLRPAEVKAFDLTKYLGLFESLSGQFRVYRENDALLLEITSAMPGAPKTVRRLQPINETDFASFLKPSGIRIDDISFHFDEPAQPAAALFAFMRMHPRSS